MSLALWSFFWTEADWTPAPPPAPPPVGASNIFTPGITDSGGGRGIDHPPPPDFWDVREAYLRSVYETPPQSDISADNAAAIAEWEARKTQIEQLAADRFKAITELRSASSLAEMKAKGAQIAELTSKIATLSHKQAFQNFMKH